MKDGQAETRKCAACELVMPLTPKNFPRFPGSQDSFQPTCKRCKRAAARKKKLDALERGAIDAFTQRAIRGGATVPHTAELLESLMNYFGGVNGFASMAMKQYWDAAPGSRMRSSVLEMIVRLATKNTEAGGARKPLQLYSEEELETEINKRLEQAVLTYGGIRYVNGTHEEICLPAPDSADHLVFSEGRAEDLAVRAEREAHRGLEALQADAPAEAVSRMSGVRDASDRG